MHEMHIKNIFLITLKIYFIQGFFCILKKVFYRIWYVNNVIYIH